MLLGNQRVLSGSFCAPSQPLEVTWKASRWRPCHLPASQSKSYVGFLQLSPRCMQVRSSWLNGRDPPVVPVARNTDRKHAIQALAQEGEPDSGTAGRDSTTLQEDENEKDTTEQSRNQDELPVVKFIAGAQARVLDLFQLLFGWVARIPAWNRQRQLRILQQISNEDTKDPEKFAKFLSLLNKENPLEVLDRVDSGKYATNSTVVAEYMSALVSSGRIGEYARDTSPDVGQDHRSMEKLLQDLQAMSDGDVSQMTPGASPKVPLHVYLERGSVARGPMGLLEFVAMIFRWTSALVLLCFLWLLGSGVVRKMSVQNLPTNGLAPTSRDKAPSVAPKQFVKEDLPEKSVKTFDDVKGCSESKEELSDVVAFLKHPEKFTRMGATLPKGVLLTGPPGTGKTLLARAVAGEAGVPFFYSDAHVKPLHIEEFTHLVYTYRAGSEFEEMFVGVGSRRVRALFNAAKKNAPCIVFIDEIDAIGASRKHWENQTRKTLNQLLVEMDGFEVNEGIIVIGATNLPETLDSALTRAGRFDRHITVPLPDVKGRQEILEYYLKGKPVGDSVKPEEVAQQTRGFSGAEIYNLVNEAALTAAKEDKTAISKDLIDHAKDKILMGMERRSLVRTEESIRRTAYHESGHALVAVHTTGANKIHKATIVPRGNALGMVQQTPGKDEYSVSKQQLIARIDVCMGGKVAEEIIFGREHLTSGASSDLQQATATAEHMVMQCGMSDEIGPIYIPNRNSLSADVQRKVDNEVTKLLKDAHQRVTTLLTEKKDELHAVSQALVQRETMNMDEILEVIGETGEKALQVQR